MKDFVRIFGAAILTVIVGFGPTLAADIDNPVKARVPRPLGWD